MLFNWRSILTILSLMILVFGCARERPSSKPPIHLNPNMDSQPKYKAQSENDFFENGSSMRPPVPGTVARGDLRADNALYLGQDSRGNFIKTNPLTVNMNLLKRGQERYDIYCSPCHSRVGDGRGIMVERGYVPPPSFHDERIRTMPDGQIFDVITHGIRNMPSYANQIPVMDRWAIIAYMRALERSQNATIDDIPVEMRDKIKE